jgi:transcriptional regulator with PAS, ATPase and Fis domain
MPAANLHRCQNAGDQSTVLEAELFGYEAGAFTSAEKRKPGLMEIANEGILFLDEIASTPTDIQVKLLRALEERSFRRVGGTNVIKVDVMVIAASNRNLPEMVRRGEFREDLYYRLKVVDLHIPPSRIIRTSLVVGLFVRQINLRMGLSILDLTPLAAGMLNYSGLATCGCATYRRAMLFPDRPPST